MTAAVCPDCDESIRVPGKPQLGQRFVCQSCSAELEVINLEPIELDWAFDEPEDDDDDWDMEWDEGADDEDELDEEDDEDYIDDYDDEE